MMRAWTRLDYSTGDLTSSKLYNAYALLKPSQTRHSPHRPYRTQFEVTCLTSILLFNIAGTSISVPFSIITVSIHSELVPHFCKNCGSKFRRLDSSRHIPNLVRQRPSPRLSISISRVRRPDQYPKVCPCPAPAAPLSSHICVCALFCIHTPTPPILGVDPGI